ncbi:hypothetical protein ACFWXK_10405 [Streptomyces sp. NPDC059070]|uniref:hypothetical protein n=1 Tax=Streptomyces sp. NPDC059070 TaxID=3346713 RepID=UPI0036935F8C
MIVRSLFVYGLLPLYGILVARSVRAARRKPTVPAAPPGQPIPFWRHFLQHCAGFPLMCLLLISLIWVFPGRLP